MRMSYDDGVTRRGTIFFDAGCGLCSAGVRRWQGVAERAGFDFVPLQDARAQRIFDLAPGELPKEVKLITSDDRILGGVDAFAYVARYVWWAFPFHLVMRVEFVRLMMYEAYKPVARHRQRISAVCGLRPAIS
jgi:predicted DCC family thiol-disulfide oxidoreductase YuxK